MSLELGDITLSSSIVWILGSIVFAWMYASFAQPGTMQPGCHGNISQDHLYSHEDLVSAFAPQWENPMLIVNYLFHHINNINCQSFIVSCTQYYSQRFTWGGGRAKKG